MAKKMKIHLEADYKIHTAFSPVYRPGGQLTAVHMLTHFTHAQANVVIPQEILIPQLNEHQRVLLLQDQINMIEKHYEFFNTHSVDVAINIDELLAKTILESDFLIKRMAQMKCIELEISESFPEIAAGNRHPLLYGLSQHFHLSLNNYGAGKATSKAVFDNLFHRIKLDKTFVQHNIKRLSFAPFIKAILEHIKPHCHAVVVQGVDDLTGLQIVRDFAFDGIQSALFPCVSEESLSLLTDPPYLLQQRLAQ